MEHEHRQSLRLLTKTILNVLLVWGLANVIPMYFVITGSWVAYIVIGALITLLNFFVRPILYVISLPFKLFATILALIIVNGLFVQLLYEASLFLDQSLVTLDIQGGLMGWSIVAIAFGLSNWLMKIALK
ncbi:phage holin family protein [Candidatus Peregrinibacteria bacterium]|nr:phage holin family protein [Candidatus Peregrinibacteria bacterium]